MLGINLNKKASTVKILFSIVLVVALGFIGYKIYEIIPGEKINLNVQIQKENLSLENVSSSLEMFMPNMRFNSSVLTYSFSDTCPEEKIERMTNAFEIMSDETDVLNFERKSDGVIKIFCDDKLRENSKNTFIAGEGGPENVINSSMYPLILNGNIYLYETQKEKKCEYPVVEIHELMHVLGFNHIADEKSVLYPYLDCEQRLNDDMINEIRRLYSFDPKAELVIKDASVSKSGIYLDFSVSIENSGLLNAKNVVLLVMDKKNVEIKKFELGDIDVGVISNFDVKNLKLNNKNDNEVIFRISTITEEFYVDNNVFIANI